MILTSLALSLAPVAQQRRWGSIDDEWPRVNSCARLAAFRAHFGENSRYASYYAEKRRELGGCAPPPPPPPRPQTVRRTPPPSPPPPPVRRPPPPAVTRTPVLMQTVILDSSGRGDVTTLQDAQNRVAQGGVILVRPGSYFGGITLVKSITIRGIVDSGGNRPTIQTFAANSPTLSISTASITLDSLNVCAWGANANALTMSGGALNAKNVAFKWLGTRVGDPTRAGNAAIYFYNANVTITGSTIGPGESQALAVNGNSVVTISSTTITNPGRIAIFAPGGTLNLRQVTISDARNAIHAQGTARIDVANTLIHTIDYRHFYPLFLDENASLAIRWSIICLAPGYGWHTEKGNATLTGSGVFSAEGTMLLTSSTTGDFPAQSRTLCAGRY